MPKSLNELEKPDATTVFQKNGFITFSRNVFDRIHFILAGNDDIHKSFNEFEIRQDPTMDYGVGCP